MEQQYTHIKLELEERLQKLEERLKETDHFGFDNSLALSTGELSQYDNHPADSGTELYEREKDLALKENLEREIEDIQYSLRKFENGTYGICEVTGQPISQERLEAYPTARTTVEHSKGELSVRRPVEEEVLGNFDKFNFDGDEENENMSFDAEDSWQAVARFNENSMIFEDSSLDETGELIGYVEEIEAFVSTDIEGYRGDDSVDFQRNIHYDQYLNDK
ncbi:TraR/DksA C4-type zinc finger protein [Bacillus alkalicellulosilyticus]|uniref:TraR/DksA C4-type zinc finger protein n=1 Tax=Alkalihalobacterium alkalicellulosilyticum TaxID=1912214 RepID=UPI0009976F67|nr:TraR/DksA C4-type zinc finger protein [Bacillus alkalicellulosilyticus]